MRISGEQRELLTKNILALLPNAAIYLFGSRADDNKKGGDVDIMVIADRELAWKEKSLIKNKYFEKFGEQKLDIVSFSFNETDPFKQIAINEGVKL
ncbi:MAG: nucleotidyltransferase domain-containing protein [Elusimicrobiota bacterium]|nr:nucleotidyltransferase domain-containing protein [Elusimicrobiota bacterium]